ncbi:Prolyl oligopeptidase family protein [Novosphingobium sp. CF614]|uniref:S9 family peptidase n=1 Tax=Novosphingobium sp. CF614 TaxID=1884364 RepID=UPI0008F1C8BC|nr:DPP IV N-terminal domain-containing protein [Novosphingobium sp. CF614]SFG35688.1 Prolyl oligopeptidase family protein [Novosphingobium sp. CF614]
MAITKVGTRVVGVVLAVALAAGRSAANEPGIASADRSPAIDVRYARADAFVSPRLGAMLVDADLQPSFTPDGAGLLFLRGTPGSRSLHYLALESLQDRVVASEDKLLAALAAKIGQRISPSEFEIGYPEYGTTDQSLRFTFMDRRWMLGPDGALTEVHEEAVSPDGRYLIVAHGYDLYAQDRKTGREVRLTTDGTRDRPYGRGIATLPDILRAGSEEPPMPVSAAWSPDSRRILTWRLDTRDVPRLSITQQNPPGSLYPRSFSYIYPLAGGTRLPQAERLAIDVEEALRTGRAHVVPLAIPAESLLYPNDPHFEWQGDRARAVWTERGYGQVAVYDADPVTGAARVVARERMKPLVFVTSSFFHAAPGLGGELDVSERTGWAQLYLVRPDDPDGGIALTHGDWEVIGIEHVDPDARTVLVTGVGHEPDRDRYFRALYRVPVAGGDPVLLTPEPLDHEVAVSPDGKWFVDAMSSPAEPTRTVLRDARDGHVVLELAHADAGALRAIGYNFPETFDGVAADGHTPLHAMIYRPIGFDPKRRYPIIDNVYTGPTTTQVPTTWAGTIASSSSSVAQIGVVVVQIDGRGTSRRGQAFRLPSYQNLGEVGLDDHIAMIRQMAARYPSLDATRVGVYGGSAGGYDAARFVMRRPDFFKVSVAWSGNHDLRLDKAWWPEASMGNADPATWERNSNMSTAGNLTGKLLLVHGDIDDNVPVTESLRLEKAIIDAGRDVDLVILPNTRHRVYQPFFWRKFRHYFTRHLLNESPPGEVPQ